MSSHYQQPTSHERAPASTDLRVIRVAELSQAAAIAAGLEAVVLGTKVFMGEKPVAQIVHDPTLSDADSIIRELSSDRGQFNPTGSTLSQPARVNTAAAPAEADSVQRPNPFLEDARDQVSASYREAA